MGDEKDKIPQLQNDTSKSSANSSTSSSGVSFSPPPYGISAANNTSAGPNDTVQDLFRGEEQVETDSGLGAVNNPVFDESRMRDEMMNAEFQGADNVLLNEAMTAIQGTRNEEGLTFPSVDEVMPHLQTIAELRGLDIEEVKSQYGRMQEIKNAGEARGAANDHEGVSPLLNTEEHPDFMGSTSQLRFGMAIGDVFDIDPVFGALISPTGGAVGPGNDAISDWDKNNPIVMHGSVHDAAGYLLNAHGIGPGYNYLQRGWELNRTNPLSGQVSGVNYFTGGVSGLASDAWDGAKGLASDAWDGAKGLASDAWNGATNWASDKWNGAKGLASDAWNGAKDGISSGVSWAGEQAGNAWEGASNWASDRWDSTKQGVSNGASWVGDKASSAWDATTETASNAWNAGTSAASNAWDTTSNAASNAWDATTETASNVANAGASAASSAWNSTTNAASSAWDSGTSAASNAWDSFTGLFD